MSDTQFDSKTLSLIYDLIQLADAGENWKATLDNFLVELRKLFVFDNIAIYIVDSATLNLEIVHARAVGRGKAAEADAAWGEDLANQVFMREKLVVQKPSKKRTERLAQAHLLGVPLYRDGKIFGAMVFIRFGGPNFDDDHIALAKIAGVRIASLVIRKLCDETRKQLNSLQQKVQLQDDFVATISHELRTPLGFIKGYSTTLLRADTDWDDETKNEFLKIIDEETDRLASLIDNILESAKLQSQPVQLNLQPVRLDALIRDIVLRVRTHHAELDIDVHAEKTILIQGDVVRLTQVFDNLISNAIKYANQSKIIVRIENSDTYQLVTFSDQGPGIAKAYLPFLFERFYRVPDEKSSKGSGLGLYICNQIVTAHHGKIWVESEMNQGTTFYIQLPVNLTL